MKPSEIYSMTPEEVYHSASYVAGCYYNHVPEVDTYALDWDKVEESKRLEVRCYKHIQIDHRRYWNISGIFFDGKPVMITQNAGREGDDHVDRFITDVEEYKKMVSFLQSMCIEEGIEDVVNIDDDISNLGFFYGYSLSD